jgi:hypothetical protein
MRSSLRCWFGAMRLLTANYRMGCCTLYVDPKAFSLKDCPPKFAAPRRQSGAQTAETAK